MIKMQPFGSDELRKQFHINDEKIFLNHGSYGIPPLPVIEKRTILLAEQDKQADVWFRVNMNNYYMEAVKAAADFFDSDVEDTYIVDNTTTGINCILKSLKTKFGSSSEILLTSQTYVAVQNTAQEIENFHGFKRTYIQLPVPIKEENDIIEMYEKQFQNNKNIKLAVIDHISIPSAIVFPVKKLVDLCRKYSVVSVVDGAHAPGQLSVSFRELGADFYAGSMHKWAFSSRSCGVLWVSPSFRGQILPLVTSNYRQTLHRMYAYLGVRDDSNFYTLPTALQFHKEAGGVEAITAYASELLVWAQTLICEALGTSPFRVPASMRAPCMALVRMPDQPANKKKLSGDELTVQFWKDYSVQVFFPEFNQCLWLRMCASIYNRRSDYLKLRDCLLDYFQLTQKS